jgi:hypothetical protein
MQKVIRLSGKCKSVVSEVAWPKYKSNGVCLREEWLTSYVRELQEWHVRGKTVSANFLGWLEAVP